MTRQDRRRLSRLGWKVHTFLCSVVVPSAGISVILFSVGYVCLIMFNN